MSYKEYAMGMSFRLNPKHIRKDTFLVPFEGLSREQEMYDTYIAPLDSSSEELVAGYNEGGIVEREGFANSNPKMGFKGTTELTYDILDDENIQSFIKKEIGNKKFSKLEFSDAKPYGVSQRENRPLFRSVQSAIKKYKLIEEARINPENVRYGQFMSMTSGIPGSTGGEFATKSLAEVLDIEEKLSNELSKILKKQDDSLIPSRAELGRKYKVADSTVEKIIRDYFGDEVYEKKFNPVASKQRLVGNDKLLYDTIVDLDTISAKKLSQDLGWSKKKTNETMVSLLNKIYVKRGTGVSSFLPDDYPLLSEVVDKIRSAPDFEDVYQRRISSLVLEAYPTNSKADMAAKKLIRNKLGEYWKVTGELKKQFPQLAANLDHVIPFTFLQEVEAGKNPLNLIRVKPIPQITNKFKIAFDKARTDNIKALNANPNDKQALNQYKALKKLEKTLPFDVGGTSRSGKILDWKALPISEADLLDDLNKFPQIYNDTLSYIDKVKTDPNLQKLFFEAGVASKDQPKSKQFKFAGLSQYEPLNVREQKKYNTFLTDIISKQLTEKEKGTIELVKKFNSSPGMMKMYDKDLLLSIGDDFKKIGTKLAPFVKGGLRVVGGILLGTTRPEVAATLAIDAMFPVSKLAQGASLKEAMAASFFNDVANLFGVGIDDAKVRVEELVSAGKDIGLTDQEIKRLQVIVNQFDNQVKLQDATTEYQRFLNAEKERGPEYIDPFFASEFQNAEKNYNDALKDFETYDQEQALSDFDILKRALNKKIGYRAERRLTGPQETIQDTGGLPPKLTTEPLSKFEKAAIEEVGQTIPQGRGVDEEGNPLPQLSDVALQDITGKTLPELQQQQAQYVQEQEAMTELDEGLLSMMNQAVEEGRQGFKKGGMVQRQGFANGPKIPRRGFLGLLAGIGAYLTTALTSKPTTKIGKEILKQAPKVQGTPEWFPLLTDIIAKKGKDISAKAATEDGMIIKQIKIDGDEVNGVFYRDGKIEVDVNSADGAFEQPYTLMYDPPSQTYVEGKGFVEVPGNFSVIEESPRSYWTGDPKNPDVDYDFDFEDVNFGQHISDTTKLEKFATGKPERLIRNKSGQTPGSNNPDPVETLVEKYGEYDGPYED